MGIQIPTSKTDQGWDRQPAAMEDKEDKPVTEKRVEPKPFSAQQGPKPEQGPKPGRNRGRRKSTRFQRKGPLASKAAKSQLQFTTG